MYDIGDFIEYLTAYLGYTFVLPDKAVRPRFPYFSITGILSIQGDLYQAVKELAAGQNEVIEFKRASQFSFTAIADSNTGQASSLAQELRNAFQRQDIIDWFQARREVLRIIGQPQPRYIVQDDFNEERWGFDIEIGDTVSITDAKNYIETLTTRNTNGFIEDIITEQDGSL